MNWYTVTGDNVSVIEASLKDGNGNAVNLTGATVILLYREQSSSTSPTSVACTVTDATAGVVQARPTFSTAGFYVAEFEVTFTGGSVQTFPTASPFKIIVRSDLN